MIVRNTFKFPGGSVVLYENKNFLPSGELVIYSGRIITEKFFCDVEKISQNWNSICERIKEEIIDSVRWIFINMFSLDD